MIAYKVARELTPNIYYSALATGKAKIVYQIGKLVIIPNWLKKEGIFPLLFDSLDTAMRWRNTLASEKDFAVLVCDVDKQVTSLTKLRLDSLSIGEIKESNSNEFPLGTVSYKKVTPIRRHGPFLNIL